MKIELLNRISFILKKSNQLKNELEQKRNKFIGLYGLTLNLNKKEEIYLSIITNLQKNLLIIELLELNNMGVCERTGIKKTFKYPYNLKRIIEWILKKKFHKLDTAGTIYLVTDGEFTKIGATSYNVNKRLNELQTGNARKLHLMGYYYVANKISSEKLLHEIFKEKQVLGEWFNLSKEDIDFILSNQPQKENFYLNKLIFQLEELIKKVMEIAREENKMLTARYLNKLNQLHYNYNLDFLIKTLNALTITGKS